MTIKICKRCRKKDRIYAKGLCMGCYNYLKYKRDKELFYSLGLADLNEKLGDLKKEIYFKECKSKAEIVVKLIGHYSEWKEFMEKEIKRGE